MFAMESACLFMGSSSRCELAFLHKNDFSHFFFRYAVNPPMALETRKSRAYLIFQSIINYRLWIKHGFSSARSKLFNNR